MVSSDLEYICRKCGELECVEEDDDLSNALHRYCKNLIKYENTYDGIDCTKRIIEKLMNNGNDI